LDMKIKCILILAVVSAVQVQGLLFGGGK